MYISFTLLNARIGVIISVYVMILKEEYGEHNTGQDENSYTYSRRPVELKHFETFTDVNQAIAREKQLKGWSRKKKQALIAQNFDKLKEFSKSKSGKKDSN